MHEDFFFFFEETKPVCNGFLGCGSRSALNQQITKHRNANKPWRLQIGLPVARFPRLSVCLHFMYLGQQGGRELCFNGTSAGHLLKSEGI